MAQITITEKQENQSNLFYVQSAIADIISQVGCKLESVNMGSRFMLKLNVDDIYLDIVKCEIIDRLSEIVAINYKYKYFKKEIGLKGLTEDENEILLASLISADLEDDKRYVREKIKNSDFLSLDGIYNFRLQPLKRKWADIVSYMPVCFVNSQLKDFIVYLLENKRERVYVDGGKVYDWHYRRLNRCELLGGNNLNIIREVLLSNCGEVDISGSIPEKDEYYLKEFYKDKICFSGKHYS